MNDDAAIASRLNTVRQRIESACIRARRDPADVTLVAVSKFHSASAIEAAYAAGQRQFGESYAQELSTKALELAHLPGLCFRFIGGLQTNKIKLLAQSRCAIDSLASESAARTLAKQLDALRVTDPALRCQVLLQVNVAAEPQKSGVSPGALPELIACVRAQPLLDLRGLMTIPPADDPDMARRCFRALRELAGAHGLSTLSMGMSDDLELAIEEGSTMVRVGTAIFGARAASV